MKKRSFGIAAAGFLLVSAFAAAMLLTAAGGASVYRNVARVMEEQYSFRTAASYISARVHQCASAGDIEIRDLSGTQALAVPESDGYVTYIYCWGGYLRELFCPEKERLLPSDGTPVVAAESAKFTENGGLLKVECRTSAGDAVEYVCVSGEGSGK